MNYFVQLNPHVLYYKSNIQTGDAGRFGTRDYFMNLIATEGSYYPK